MRRRYARTSEVVLATGTIIYMEGELKSTFLEKVYVTQDTNNMQRKFNFMSYKHVQNKTRAFAYYTSGRQIHK